MTDFLDLINYEKRINSMSWGELMAEGNRLLAYSQALDNKEKSTKLACQTRSKSLPKNATIRKEFVKCKKPNCYHRKHGPYYYAYWKDPETKRLKKKYIGRHFERVNLSANMEQVETDKLNPNQPELNQKDKQKRKKKVLVYA
jgi:hypothetical protein